MKKLVLSLVILLLFASCAFSDVSVEQVNGYFVQSPSNVSRNQDIVSLGIAPHPYGYDVGEIITMKPWWGGKYFVQCYLRWTNLGAQNKVYLWNNVGWVHRWGNGLVQDFTGGRYGDGIIMLKNSTSRAYCIWGAAWQMYKSNPMRGTNTSGINWLGYPTSDIYYPSSYESRRLNWYGGGQQNAYRGGTVIYFELGYMTYTNGLGTWWTKLR